MPLNERYYELTRRVATGLQQAEQAGWEILQYFSERPDPRTEVGDHPLVSRMGTDLSAVLEGLTNDDARIRLAAISYLRTPWGNPSVAAEAIRRMALNDPDKEVQLMALSRLPDFYQKNASDHHLCRELAHLALSTDDVMIRHSVYLGLCRITGIYDTAVFGVKYTALPLVFDEGFVQQFVSPNLASDIT